MSILPCRRILLISQEKAVQEITQICLETVVNCEVVTADLGNEAIAKAQTEPIDAILMDIDERAVDTDWCKLLQSLKQNPATQNIPVILLADTVQSKTLPQLSQRGVKAAIAKSCDLLALASQVAAALDWN